MSKNLNLPPPKPLSVQERAAFEAPRPKAKLPPRREIPKMGGNPPSIRPRLLLIDDNRDFLATTRLTWQQFYKDWARLEFFHFDDENRDELLELLAQSVAGDPRDRFQTVYIDLNLSGSDNDGGVGLIKALYEHDDRLRFTPFVIVTASADIEREVEARRVGAIRFFTKTAPNEAAGRNGILGTFVQRMISEAQETFEQVEDLIWAEASGKLAKALLTKPWKDACEKVIEFVHDNLAVDAMYVRHGNGSALFEQVQVNDSMGFGATLLDVNDVPFIKSFIQDKDPEPYKFFDDLTQRTAGHKYYDRLKNHRVLIARVAVKSRTLGFLTLYRPKADRLFRRQDASGLCRIADQLSGAILQEEAKQKQRQREIQMLKAVRAFDAADNERAIFENLRDGLFDTFAAAIDDPNDNLESSIRKIEPGTNQAVRACINRGYTDLKAAREVNLENHAGSSVSWAIWNNTGKLEPNLDYERDKDRFIFPRKDIKSAITAPITSQGVCFGAAILECLVADALDQDDLDFTVALCETAAAAILRLRTRAFLAGTANLAARLAEPGDGSTTELIQQVCELLLLFTGASEITYLDRRDEEDKWQLSDAFRFPGVRLSQEVVDEWQEKISEKWSDTYVRRVVGRGKSDWTVDPDEIPIDDYLVGGRRPGERTRSQAVIILRDEETGPIQAIISLLFLHRFAISATYIPTLTTLGNLLSALLRQRKAYKRLFGLNTVKEQEARLGQVFGQFRHGLMSQLAIIRQSAILAEAGRTEWPAMGAEAKRIVDDIAQEISRSKYLVKPITPETVDLGKLWKKIAEQLAGIAIENKSKILDAQLTGQTVRTDADILQAIIFNLVDNALRYGGPHTEVSAFAETGSETLDIVISDTGRGISDSVIERLFQIGQTTGSQSTGLGLYLSQSRAKDLNGNLTLRSTSSKGTSFVIRLPLKFEG